MDDVRDCLSLLQTVVTLGSMMRKRGNTMRFLDGALEALHGEIQRHIERVMEHEGLASRDLVHRTLGMAQSLHELLEKNGNILAVSYQPRFGSWMAIMVLENAVGVGVVRALAYSFALPGEPEPVVVTKYLIACSKSFTSHANRALIFNEQVQTEMFTFQELTYDITRNRCAPVYHLMEPPEVARRFPPCPKTGKSDVENFKELPTSDAQARFLGLQPGDVVYFERMFRGCDPQTVFRRVVATGT